MSNYKTKTGVTLTVHEGFKGREVPEGYFDDIFSVTVECTKNGSRGAYDIIASTIDEAKRLIGMQVSPNYEVVSARKVN
jgi:hypothetical protein